MTDIEKQLSELRSRAVKVEYKNIIPSYPKKPTQATLVGFNKRLSNWTRLLEDVEKQKS